MSEAIGGALEGDNGSAGHLVAIPPLSFDPKHENPTEEQRVEWGRRYSRWWHSGAYAPELMVREIFQVEPEDWQLEDLRAYGRRERRISTVSGHGVGKSAKTAWQIVHHLVTEFPQRTACTAPTEKQMFNVLYPEVLKWFKKLPGWVQQSFTVKSDRLESTTDPEDCYVAFATARPEKPEALAGVHCEGGSVLLVADEASGVHELVFESASGSMSGHEATTILTGNPVRSTGLFHDTQTKLKWVPGTPRTPGDWYCIHVDAEQCQRVSKDFVEDMARRYGRESNAFRVRVQGLFPRADEDTVISYEHILASQTRDIEPSPTSQKVWGLDVARFGDDRTVLVKRWGNVVPELPKVWRDKDTMQVSALVHAEYDATPQKDRPDEILVDSIGLGAGVVDRLRQLGLPVRGINVAESAALNDRYQNLKAELWFKAKEWFQKLDVKLPPDQTEPGGIALGAELALPRYRFSPSGKFQVESKMEIKKRGFPSSDLADAFVLSLASTAATFLYGRDEQMEGAVKRNNQWFALT